MNDYWQQQAKEEADRQSAISAFKAAFDPNDTINVSTVIAEYMNQAECGALALHWTIEKFWALRMPAIIHNLNRLYDKLLNDKITENHSISCNDKLWYEPCEDKKILVHTTQNINYLYIWPKGDENLKPGVSGAGLRSQLGMRKLNVRKFYDLYDLANDSFEKEEDEVFKKRVEKDGRQAAIREIWRLERYADDGVEYPKKLSLKAYRELNFHLKYNDARDPGYILSWCEFTQKVDHAMYQNDLLQIIEDCLIPSLISSVFYEED